MHKKHFVNPGQLTIPFKELGPISTGILKDKLGAGVREAVFKRSKQENEQKPFTMRQKVSIIKKKLAENPFVFEKLRGSDERKRMMEDLVDLHDHFLGELNISLAPLSEYIIGERMIEIVQSKITENGYTTLLKMSGALMEAVRQSSKRDSQHLRCAGEARTLSSLVKDLSLMQRHFDRENYLPAIEIYRKLIPEKNREGQIRKNVSKSSKMVKDDLRFINRMEAFLDQCLKA